MSPLDIKMVSEANTDFAFKLYNQLLKENADVNLFFSPFSVSVALIMVFEGARGQTADEMAKVLSFSARLRGSKSGEHPWDTETIHLHIAGLLDAFDKPRKIKNYLLQQIDQYELHVANALWGEKSYPFRQAFVDTLAKYYGNGLAIPCDFARNYEAERKRINKWVEEQTKERIKDLLAQGQVNDQTRLVVVNAIYFKGNWAEPFSEEETREEDFTGVRGRRIRAPMMKNQSVHDCRYAAFNVDGSFFETPKKVAIDDRRKDDKYPGKGGCQALELPYRGHEVSMVILLPSEADGLAGLEQRLSAEKLGEWIDQLEGREVDVTLPKFRSETTYELNDVLKTLGMPTALDPRL